MSSVISRPFAGFSKASLLVSAAAALMLAGCSDAVERFSQNPSDADPVYTASVKKKVAPVEDDVSSSSDESISSRPLASTNLSKPVYKYSAENTAPSQPVYKAPVSSGSVTVGQGMTLYSIAKANNMTVSQLAAANNLKPPYAVRQGQLLRIPGIAEAAAPAVRQATDEVAEVPPKAAPFKNAGGNGTHTVGSGETLFSLGRKYGVSPYSIADANGLSHSEGLKLGQPLKIPGAGAEVASAVEKPVQQVAEAAEETIEETTVPATKLAAETTAVPNAVTLEKPVQQVAADSGVAGLRWPVRGKIISEFGAKPNGLKNEGINISVPEGTSVRAADDGVVAYAGNELKGYGNLVLVRHAGGWVTAYAHAKELFVKRGDTVKRGDVIAKAGQTGSVSSPQLHFEVRKGAVAMDPVKYLDTSTASN